MWTPGIDDFDGTERFAIVRRIGAGGMGVVYEAHDRERDVRVALKTLPQIDARALYLFKQEFRALADVIHPNLAALHELIAVGEQWFFTMELINGVSFLEYVFLQRAEPSSDRSPIFPGEPTSDDIKTSDFTPVPTTQRGAGSASRAEGAPSSTTARTVAVDAAPEAATVSPANFERLREALAQLAEGIGALHQAGKLHRDIKPSNVLVTPDGRVVLLDFGLVAEMERQPLDPGTDLEFAGTVAYMAPEQAAGQPLSSAADWYAVGVMLYQALTGRLPFQGSLPTILRDKQTIDPPPPSALVAGLPEDLHTLCVHLLQRRPEDRPSASEIRRRLKGTPAGPATPAVPPPPRTAQLPFVGRERHLAALNAAFQAVRQRRTAAVFVHGRSGVGKSLLVQRFLEGLVAHQEVVVLTGRCYEQESVPYKALDSLVDALSRYLRRLPAHKAAELMPRHMSALARLFPVLRRVEAVAAAADLEMCHAAMGQLFPPRDAAEAASEELRRFDEVPDLQELRRRAFGALRELLARLGDRVALVLSIDDLQWGDVDSAALLSDLLRPPDPPVLLLLGSYRSEYVGKSPCLRTLVGTPSRADPALDRIELVVEDLSRDEARTLALELLGRDNPAAASQAEVIARESGGSPFFVRELVEYLSGGAKLPESGAAAKITLEEVLLRRVASLPETARRLLEVVAVAGRPLRQGDAYRAAELGPANRTPLAVLRVGHLVRSTGPGEQDEVEPYHDRIRETVTAHLSAGDLTAHHRRLAVTLAASGQADPETLAVHFHGAAELARAGHYYAAAAGEAAEALAFERAAKLYRLSQELRPVAGAEGRALRTRLGDALAHAGRGPEAAAEYLTVAEQADGAERMEMERRAAYHYLVSGRYDDGQEAMRRVLSRVGLKLPATPGRALLSLLFRRALLYLRGLGFKEQSADAISPEELARIDITWSASVGLTVLDTIRAADFQTRNLLLALRAGEPYRLARALAWEAAHAGVGGVAVQGYVDRLLRTAREIAQRIDNPHHVQGLITLAAGTSLHFQGQWQKCRELCEQAESIFRDHCTGVAWEIDTAQSFICWSLTVTGDIVELARRLPLLVKEARERGDLYVESNVSTYCAPLVWMAADDPEGGRRTVHEVMGRWSQRGFHSQHYMATDGLTRLDLYRGEWTAAWERLTSNWPAIKGALLLRVESVRIQLVELRARCALAVARGAQNPRPYWRAAAKDLRRLEQEQSPWAKGLAELTRASLAASQGDRANALRLLEAAVASLDATGLQLFAAAARCRWGELLGGERGRELVAQANTALAAQNVRNPERMIACHTPGFPQR